MINEDGDRTCDLCDDGKTEATTISFSWNGGGWLVDLCEPHAVSFFDLMKPFIDSARMDEAFIDPHPKVPNGYRVIPAHRRRDGKIVKPLIRRESPSKCPLCLRKFVMFNGLGAHIHKVHTPEEKKKIGWHPRMTYEEYQAIWPELDSATSTLSLAGLVTPQNGNGKKPRKTT